MRTSSATFFLAITFWIAACDGSPPHYSLREQVAANPAAVKAEGTPAAKPVVAGNERRWAFSDANVHRIELELPRADGVLRFSAFGPAGFRVRVSDSKPRLLTNPLPAGWNDLEVPLGGGLGFGSRTVALEVLDCADAPCGFGDAFFGAEERKTNRPNLIFILVDTLRNDALGIYGGSNQTPRIDAIGRNGVVFDRAIAQASWTLPSVSSLFCGVWPSISPGWSLLGQGVNPNITTFAEIMANNGYATAAFVANPLIKDDLGFGRGFDTYWGSPPAAGVLTTAEEPVTRAAAWIRTYQGKPFFAYVHLMDPHDPYAPQSKRVGGVPSGGNPDPAFTGAVPLPDAQTIREWRSLYDEEVRWVDQQIGALLETLPGDIRSNTVIVLTSDHGEEFMEHGFLKHGPTLFDESIRVPLIFSGPGVVPGKRVGEIGRLVDVVPTLAELLRLDVPRPVQRRWSGVSLARTIGSDSPMPQLTAMSETFGFGPMRWCIYDGTDKAFLFNKGHKLPTEFPALPFPLRWIETNLPVEAVYRVTPDQPFDQLITPPDEQKLRWGREKANEYVAGKVGGVWLSLRGDGKTGLVKASLRVDRKKVHLTPFFWRPGDSIKSTASGYDVAIANDGLQRLAVLTGATNVADVAIHGTTAGLPVTKGRPQGNTPGLFYWFEAEPLPTRPDADANKELRVRLRALGYIQ